MLEAPAAQPSPDRMSDLPFVSVAVITYNNLATIRRCLESILVQDYPRDKYEIVVVDGESTDGTLDLLQKFPVRIIIERRKNRGIARNTAVENSKGGIVAFTDADCQPAKLWLRRHVSLHSEPNVMAVAGSVLQGGDLSLPTTIYHRSYFGAQSPFGSKKATWDIATCNASFKRSAFTVAGPFQELHRGEEGLLCWKILQSGFQVIFDPAPIVSHLHTKMSFASLFKRSWEEGYYTRRIQDAFGERSPYKLPREFIEALFLLPSLVIAKMARYFVKVVSGSSCKADSILFLPFLLATSLFWTFGYVDSAHRSSGQNAHW